MSKLMPIPPRVILFTWLAALFAFACQVRFVSPYDEVIDTGTVGLHTKIGSFVRQMEALSGKPEGTFEANQATYSEIDADIATLRLRSAAIPKNTFTTEQFDLLIANVKSLKQLHQLGAEQGLRPKVAQPALAALDTNCLAIIRLEIAKKRGEE